MAVFWITGLCAVLFTVTAGAAPKRFIVEGNNNHVDGNTISNNENTYSGTSGGGSSSACQRDVVFVVDDSGSIGTSSFVDSVNLIREVVNNLNIGPTEAQVAVMEYSSQPQVNWYLSQYRDKADVLRLLGSLNYMSGSTKTADALEAARVQILGNGHGERPNAENVVIVMTDGQSADQSDTIREAAKLHTISRDVITITIGSGTNNNELNAIATDSKHIFDFTNTSNMYLIASRLIKLICN